MKIGITECGDPSLDFSWVNKVDTVDGIILITKNLTDIVIEKASQNLNKFIFHVTCTGFGGSVLEPNIPNYNIQLEQAQKLIKLGVDLNKIVIRVDPIIPTEKGLRTARTVIKTAINMGFIRFRVSLLDAYPHVRARFIENGIPTPYGDYFSPNIKMIENANKMFAELKVLYPEIVIESCAEKDLIETEILGCVSKKDFELLGLNTDLVDSVGYQRKNCLCCSAKTELLEKKQRCPYNCLYCYWKNN